MMSLFDDNPGVFVGGIIGLACCLLVVVQFGLDMNTDVVLGLRVYQVLTTYIVGGLAGGMLVDWCAHWINSRIRAAVAGVLASGPFLLLLFAFQAWNGDLDSLGVASALISIPLVAGASGVGIYSQV